MECKGIPFQCINCYELVAPCENPDDHVCGKNAKVDQSGLETGYVRCRFCDTDFYTDTVKDHLVWMGNRPDVKHRRVEFDCPACGFKNEECFVFTRST